MTKIRQQTIEKTFSLLNDLKELSEKGIRFNSHAVTAKYSTTNSIPYYALRIGYFSKREDKTWECHIDKFEPIHARKLLNYYYGKRLARESGVVVKKQNNSRSPLEMVSDSELLKELKNRGYSGEINKKFTL